MASTKLVKQPSSTPVSCTPSEDLPVKAITNLISVALLQDRSIRLKL